MKRILLLPLLMVLLFLAAACGGTTVEQAKEKAQDAAATAQDAAAGAAEQAKEAVATAQDAAADAAEEAKEKLGEAQEQAKEAAADAKDAVEEAASDVKEAVEDAVATEEAMDAEMAEEEAAMAPLVEGDYLVGIMQLVSHPALDAEREGAIQALAENGFVDGENLTIDYQNAEGDIATLTTIAQKFVDEDVDLIIAITTPAVQAAYNVTQDLEGPPIVFTAVTDPYAAGVATAPDDHPAWVTGIQGMPPVEDAMAVIQEVLPDVQSIGMIWNTAEKNSEVATSIARDTAAKMGIELVEANIADSSEVQTAAESLAAQGVDAFFVSTDSTVVAGFEALVKVAEENDIPLFANDPASSERGAVAALGLDYFQDGLDAGTIAVTILKGEAAAGDITIERQRAGLLAVNLKSVVSQAVELPDSVVNRAAQVFD
ncbi:MAG: ABC transporter substrate-binding protein [Anaerolineae bacterium]|nr:ABC transporter substrate-binding protein [Anaerolineae bacterium]